MDTSLLWFDGKFLGIEWHFWKVVGWLGNVTFFSRFLVQWYATEKRKRVVVPSTFWWLSLVGTGLLLSYALFYQRDSVFIAAYALNWIPYVRNLVIHYRTHRPPRRCERCANECPAEARFCPACGAPLGAERAAPAATP